MGVGNQVKTGSFYVICSFWKVDQLRNIQTSPPPVTTWFLCNFSKPTVTVFLVFLVELLQTRWSHISAGRGSGHSQWSSDRSLIKSENNYGSYILVYLCRYNTHLKPCLHHVTMCILILLHSCILQLSVITVNITLLTSPRLKRPDCRKVE